MGRHASHAIHQHSLWSWREMDLPERSMAVLEVLELLGRPATDRHICETLGSQDMNYARPSITHLVHDGVLVEVDPVKCPVTGRTVRQVWFPRLDGV